MFIRSDRGHLVAGLVASLIRRAENTSIMAVPTFPHLQHFSPPLLHSLTGIFCYLLILNARRVFIVPAAIQHLVGVFAFLVERVRMADINLPVPPAQNADVADSPDEPLPSDEAALAAVNNSAFSNVVSALIQGVELTDPAFNWALTRRMGILNNHYCLVPKGLDQRCEGICIVCASWTLFQFQLNLLHYQRGQKAPKLSFEYLKWVFENKLNQRTADLARFLRWIELHGMIVEEDYDTDLPEMAAEGVHRYYIDWNYAFEPEQVADFDNELRRIILRSGGCLADLKITKEFYAGRGKSTYRAEGRSMRTRGRLDISHIVPVFGWRQAAFEYLNSHGEKFGRKIGPRKGNGRAVRSAVLLIFVPQIRLEENVAQQ